MVVVKLFKEEEPSFALSIVNKYLNNIFSQSGNEVVIFCSSSKLLTTILPRY